MDQNVQIFNNKGKALTLIDKGFKFGGNTPLDWESPSGYKDITNKLTFLFSINQKFTIKITKDQFIVILIMDLVLEV